MQVLYLGRYVDKDTFRTFVYNDKEQKLANSYEEFESLIASGIWFAVKPKEKSLLEIAQESLAKKIDKHLVENEELAKASNLNSEIKLDETLQKKKPGRPKNQFKQASSLGK